MTFRIERPASGGGVGYTFEVEVYYELGGFAADATPLGDVSIQVYQADGATALGDTDIDPAPPVAVGADTTEGYVTFQVKHEADEDDIVIKATYTPRSNATQADDDMVDEVDIRDI